MHAPEVIIKQMLKIHQFAIMCAPTTSQYAAVEALRNGDEDVAMMRKSTTADAVMYWSGSKRWDFPVLNHLEHFMRSLVLGIWV